MRVLFNPRRISYTKHIAQTRDVSILVEVYWSIFSVFKFRLEERAWFQETFNLNMNESIQFHSILNVDDFRLLADHFVLANLFTFSPAKSNCPNNQQLFFNLTRFSSTKSRDPSLPSPFAILKTTSRNDQDSIEPINIPSLAISR